VALANTYSVGTACAMTVQEQRKIYSLYSHENLYKLNTERKTLRDGHLLAIGDHIAYQQTWLLYNASIVLLETDKQTKNKINKINLKNEYIRVKTKGIH
jgi:hypothetical protein